MFLFVRLVIYISVWQQLPRDSCHLHKLFVLSVVILTLLWVVCIRSRTGKIFSNISHNFQVCLVSVVFSCLRFNSFPLVPVSCHTAKKISLQSRGQLRLQSAYLHFYIMKLFHLTSIISLEIFLIWQVELFEMQLSKTFIKISFNFSWIFLMKLFLP